MFESSFYNLLNSDYEITSRLSTFGGAPSIFADYAPEEGDQCGPYIVFAIEENDSDSLIIDTFFIDVDIYGLRSAAKTVREVVEHVRRVCDRAIINGDDRFSTIRLYRDSNEIIYETDSKLTHYIVRLQARATRKKWADQITRS